MRKLMRFALAGAAMMALAACQPQSAVRAAGGPEGPAQPAGSYRVLAPIESGNLLLFPVVLTGAGPQTTPFLTLDEGLRSGDVEVAEAGRARGLVRARPSIGVPPPGRPEQIPDVVVGERGDQVNTLVLVNHSDRPLLLLAGEIVTGGKQDRVIAKDRIVPGGADPIDLGVFCIEPGRWVARSDTFGAAAKAPAQSFMVQPSVRERAMVDEDQQQVWNQVHSSIASMKAAAPAASALSTTSYAQTLADSEVSARVDKEAASASQSNEQILRQLKERHAVGVVVAVRGELVWADVFATPELLARYWTKLVRSYAAESLSSRSDGNAPTVAEAERFLEGPRGGRETSEGELGVYRYREVRGAETESFMLESLLKGAAYEVHLSRVKLRVQERRMHPHFDHGPRIAPPPGLVY